MRATIQVIWELGPQLCSRALSLPQETKGDTRSSCFSVSLEEYHYGVKSSYPSPQCRGCCPLLGSWALAATLCLATKIGVTGRQV